MSPREIEEQIIRSIDPAALDAISSRHSSKFLNLKRWIPRNVKRAVDLGLHVGAPRRVLDLGCGAGYFVRVCSSMGHDAIGVDSVDRDGVYSELAELVGARVVAFTIAPFEPIPDLGEFDVVVAHMVTFNGHRSPQLWASGEWRFFLDDLARILRPGGTVCLDLNREPGCAKCYTPELEDFFLSRGAALDDFRVVIRDVTPTC